MPYISEKTTMLKAVIFDMDGVIIDSEPLHRKAYYKMFDTVNVQVSDVLYESFTGQSTYNVCKTICEHFNLTQYTPQDLVNYKRKYYKAIFDANDGLALIDGVFKLIKDYHNSGLTLVLASSASMQSITMIFNHFNLNPYFKAKLSGADLKASKPHPEIFTKAAEASGFDKNECLVIEDSTNGIKAAHAAGIYCIGFDSEHSKNQDYSLANTVISDYNSISFDKIKNILN